MIKFIFFIWTGACFILAIPNFSNAGDSVRLYYPPQQILDPEPILEQPSELSTSGLMEEDWIQLDSRGYLHVEGGLGGSAVFSKTETEEGLDLDKEEF